MKVGNPDSFFIRLGEIENFRLERIRFFSFHLNMNQDGIHIGGFCRHGLIRDIRSLTPYTPNDDMIALNADDDILRHFNQGLKRGPIEDIEIEDVYADSVYTFIRMLSQDNPIRDIRIRKIRGGCRCLIFNLNRWRFPQGKGAISDISIQDIKVFKLPEQNVPPYSPLETVPLCEINLKVDNLEIKDFYRFPVDCHKAPTLKIEFEHSGKLELGGLSEEQCRQTVSNTPGILQQDSSITYHGKGEVVLQNGGFSYLRLHSEK